MEDKFTFKKRLTRFYKKYCPDKLNDVDKLCTKYGSQEKELFRKLTFKYGPEDKMNEKEKKDVRDRNEKLKNIKNVEKKPKVDNSDPFHFVKFDNNTLELLSKIDLLGNKPITQELLDKI